MEKHAYLIIAHEEFEVLKKLLHMIDHEKNDIYIHIDKKVGDYDEVLFQKCVHKSSLTFIKNRVDVQWGNYSQIECELRLLEEATKFFHKYYHLLSGVDLPLKTQEEIHQFFEKNNGTEYVQMQAPVINDEAKNRVAKYHFFAKRKKNVIEKMADKICLLLQYNVDRTKKSGLIYQKGANWFSITHDLAKFLLNNKKIIEKNFRFTICGDEMFVQTLVASSAYNKKIVSNNYCDNYENICYCIDWIRGNPYVFRNTDFESLVNSNQLFARKFSWKLDEQIIERLSEYITEKRR